jgi:undecaprenyl-diphosphatase
LFRIEVIDCSDDNAELHQAPGTTPSSGNADGNAAAASSSGLLQTTTGKVAMLLGAWVMLTGLLIALGLGVLHSSAVQTLDHHVTSTVVAHRTPALNATMKAVTWLGSWVALITTGLIVVVLAARKRLPWLVVAAGVIAWAGEASAVTITKHVVQRPRPPKNLWLLTAHGWSWPSGHTATAAVVFAVLAITVGHVIGTRFIRTTMWAVAAIAVALVAFSRLELGVHWTTDVLASCCFVLGWLGSLFALLAVELRQGAAAARTVGSPALRDPL